MGSPEGFVELRWAPPADEWEEGRVSMVAAAYGFRGESSEEVAGSEVVGFARRLRSVPIRPDDPPRLWPRYAESSLVSITVRPIGSLGQLGMQVDLREQHRQPWLRGPGRPQEARLDVPVAYEGLARFATELEHLVAGRTDVARIDADRLLL